MHSITMISVLSLFANINANNLNSLKELNDIPIGESRLIGGHDASAGQFAHQVSLQTVLFHRHFCGGLYSNEFLTLN